MQAAAPLLAPLADSGARIFFGGRMGYRNSGPQGEAIAASGAYAGPQVFPESIVASSTTLATVLRP